MTNFLSSLFRKCGLAAASLLIALNAALAGTIIAAQPAAAFQNGNTNCAQDTYPATNILYCGVPSDSASDALSWLMAQYNANSDGVGGHHDIQSVYNASKSGFSGGQLNSVTSGKWVLGTSYSNGNITDDQGTVVGTNTLISSRCFSGMSNCQPTWRYSYLVSNVYTRDATWFFDKSTSQKTALIHINSDGVADFAMWTKCGNELFFKPVVPKKVLECVQLDKNKQSDLAYSFTAKANHENVDIDNYFFDFGDSSNQEVKAVNQDNPNMVTSSVHNYQQTDLEQTITIKVYVNKAGQHGTSGVTSGTCQQQIVIPPKEKQTFACLQLDAKLLKSSKTSRTYQFTASTQGTDKAKEYQFFFGDNHKTAFQTNNVVKHIYTFTTTRVYKFKASFIANSSTGLQTDKNDKNCMFFFATPKTLVRTGPAETFGIVAFTSTAGVALYQFVLRRRLS